MFVRAAGSQLTCSHAYRQPLPDRSMGEAHMTVVRAAITQVAWTGDKESMIDRHEELAREARRRRRPDHRLPGAVLRAVLRRRAGPEVLRVRRDDPRPDRRALPGAGQRAGPGDRAADLRGRERGRVLQHRRRDRRRRHAARAATASTTSRTCRRSGRSSTSARATSATRCSRRRSGGSASTSATTGTSRRAGASSG